MANHACSTCSQLLCPSHKLLKLRLSPSLSLRVRPGLSQAIFKLEVQRFKVGPGPGPGSTHRPCRGHGPGHVSVTVSVTSRFVTPSSWQLPVESPPHAAAPQDAEKQRSGRLHNRRRALYYRGCKHPPTRSRGRMDCGCAKVHACCSRGNCSHHFSGTGERLAGCVCGPNGKTYELDEEDVMGASDTGCV